MITENESGRFNSLLKLEFNGYSNKSNKIFLIFVIFGLIDFQDDIFYKVANHIL